MKSFEEFRDDVDQISEIDLGTRKAMARRLKIIGKKASTKFRKEKNKLKALSQDAALKKGMKRARQFVIQKLAGKCRDISDLSIAQKEKLEKRADQAAKKLGGKYKALAKKFAKVIKKAHTQRAAELKAKKSAEVT